MCADDCALCRWCEREGASAEVAAARDAIETLVEADDQ